MRWSLGGEKLPIVFHGQTTKLVRQVFPIPHDLRRARRFWELLFVGIGVWFPGQYSWAYVRFTRMVSVK